MYDIEVEGTHNFIANGIVAHNTYISGNTGMETNSPTEKLAVSGNAYITGTLDVTGNLQVDGTTFYVSATFGNVGIGALFAFHGHWVLICFPADPAIIPAAIRATTAPARR